MFKDTEKEFDLLVGSRLREMQEEVPPLAWEKVSSSLAKSRARKVVPFPFWRRVAVGAAAAAAVTLGIFIARESINSTYPTISPTNDNSIAELATPVSGTESLRPMEEQIEAVKGLTAVALYDGHEMERPGSATVPTEVTAPEEAFSTAAPDGDDGSGDKKDEKLKKSGKEREPFITFNEYLFKDRAAASPGRGRPAVVVHGLVGSNSPRSSGAGGRMRAQSADPLTAGIRDYGQTISYGLPFTVGAGVRFPLTQRLSLGTGIDASILTRSFSGSYTTLADESLKTTNAVISNTQLYLGIPVNLYYDFVRTPRFKVYAKGGGTFEKNVSNRYRIDLPDGPVVEKDKVKGLQYSVSAGIGAEFNLMGGLGLYVDPNLRYYFKNGQPASIRTTQPLMMNLEIGLRYDF